MCCAAGPPSPPPYLAGVPIFQLLLRAHCCSFSCQLPPLPFSHAGPTRWNDVGAHTCTPLAPGQGSPMADAQSRAPLGSEWGSSQVYRTQMYAWLLSLLPPVSYTFHWRQLPQEIASKGIPVSSSPSREFVLKQSLNNCLWEYRETYQILSWVFVNFLMYLFHFYPPLSGHVWASVYPLKQGTPAPAWPMAHITTCTIPPLSPWKNCLSQNWSLVPKLGDHHFKG